MSDSALGVSFGVVFEKNFEKTVKKSKKLTFLRTITTLYEEQVSFKNVVSR